MDIVRQDLNIAANVLRLKLKVNCVLVLVMMFVIDIIFDSFSLCYKLINYPIALFITLYHIQQIKGQGMDKVPMVALG